jgi:hypothetical protein
MEAETSFLKLYINNIRPHLITQEDFTTAVKPSNISSIEMSAMPGMTPQGSFVTVKLMTYVLEIFSLHQHVQHIHFPLHLLCNIKNITDII